MPRTEWQGSAGGRKQGYRAARHVRRSVPLESIRYHSQLHGRGNLRKTGPHREHVGRGYASTHCKSAVLDGLEPELRLL